MKAQGWPERVQVGLLTGSMMERIEMLFKEELRARNVQGDTIDKTQRKVLASDLLSKRGSFAGFF